SGAPRRRRAAPRAAGRRRTGRHRRRTASRRVAPAAGARHGPVLAAPPAPPYSRALLPRTVLHAVRGGLMAPSNRLLQSIALLCFALPATGFAQQSGQDNGAEERSVLAGAYTPRRRCAARRSSSRTAPHATRRPSSRGRRS